MNIYYNPEDYKLSVVDSIEWDDEAWQFNLTCVWKNDHNEFFIASDSGCSCPVPFEDVKYGDLEPHTAEEIVSKLRVMLNNHNTEYGRPYAEIRKDVISIVDKLGFVNGVQL